MDREKAVETYKKQWTGGPSTTRLDGFKDGLDVAMRDNDPVPMLLYCPRCFEQHVDEAKPDVCEKCGTDVDAHDAVGCDDFTAWLNPSHRKHRCNFCNHVWKQSDYPTTGVAALAEVAPDDQSPRPVAFANGKDFDDAVAIASGRDNDWHPILLSADDLPKEDGRYLVMEVGEPPTVYNRVTSHLENTKAWLRCRAWMSIPEYRQPQTEGER